MYLPPRSQEAQAARRHIAIEKTRTIVSPCLNGSEMREGKKLRLVRRRLLGAGERGEHFRPEQRAERVEAEERGEQVADRGQMGEPCGGGVGDAVGGQAVSMAWGTWLVRPMIMSEKKIAIEIGMPAFWKVARMPEATPRSRAGTLFMIEVVFGAANSPNATPLVKMSGAKASSRSRPVAP